MDKPIEIYSISKNLKVMNKSLADCIGVITSKKLANYTENPTINGILFEPQQISILFDTLKNIDELTTRFICVGKNLSTDDMLILLNNNIEVISPEKFTKLEAKYFDSKPGQSSYKVLIVEDDEDQVALTENILKEAKMTVKSITKGEEVLSSIKEFQPDLILMDLYLNGITGDKIVKIIRKEINYSFLPIVFLTSDKTIESRMKVLNAGADDLLTKPIHPELLVSALTNRMQRQHIFNVSTQQQIDRVVHKHVEVRQNRISTFLNMNLENSAASIIWLKVKDMQSLQKKLGYSGFKYLCDNLFKKFPNFSQQFNVKYQLADGIFVFASANKSRKQAVLWVEKLKQWLSKNYFTIGNRDYQFDVNAIILCNFPAKKQKKSLLRVAENLLITDQLNQGITFLEEGIEEKQFNLIKGQLENSIRTRNFHWDYQSIVSTKDEPQDVFQLMLRIVTESGRLLSTVEYLDVANKTGLLRLLDRFSLEHAIKMIRLGEQRDIKVQTLLNQTLSDYQTKEQRTKKFNLISNLTLPKNSMIFQFEQNDAQEHMNVLKFIGNELNNANVSICLSNFDSSLIAWELARKLQVRWVRLHSLGTNSEDLDKETLSRYTKSIRKAHEIGYKVIVTQVNSANFAAKLWKLNIDYMQGNFIQAPINDVFS